MEENDPSFMKDPVIVESETFEDFANGKPCIAGVYDSHDAFVVGSKFAACVIVPEENIQQLKDISSKFSRKPGIYSRTNVEQLFENAQIAYAHQSLSARYLDGHTFLKGTHRYDFVIKSAIDLIKYALQANINITEIFIGRSNGMFRTTQHALIRSKFESAEINAEIYVSEKHNQYPAVTAASMLATLIKDKQFKWLRDSNKLYQLDQDCPQQVIVNISLSNMIDQIFGYRNFFQFSRLLVQRAVNKGCTECAWIAFGPDLERHDDLESNRPQTKGTFFENRNVAHAVGF